MSYQVLSDKVYFYHPRMLVGNVFHRVCLFICPSVCLSVQTITFEPLHIGTSFMVWRYILTISRSSLSIKVIGSSSRSCAKNDYLLISTCYSFVCGYRSLIRSRSLIKVEVKLSSFKKREMLLRGWFTFESNAFLLFLKSSTLLNFLQ